jgi:hypothetical protein
MDGYANNVDMIQCPHCGHELRRGMVRCRECGKPISESHADEDTASDFELSGHDLVASQDPTCPLCGAVLEPGTSDCPSCTSDLLDQLLKGPGAGGASAPAPHSASPWPSSAAAELRVHRAVRPGAGTPAPARSSGAPASPAEHQLRPRALPKASPRAPAARTAKPPQRKSSAPAGERPRADRPSSPAPAPAAVESEPESTEATEEDLTNATTPVETTAACTALLASLAKADVALKCEIATALGKLGDKAAMGPLERHLGDHDVRVRRAVAGALVQLGHPKGQTLLDIAERKPAAAVMASGSAASISKPKPRRSSGGSSIDPGTLKIVGIAVLVIGIIGGGIWWWMSTPSAPAKKSKKSTATKKVTPAKKKATAE